MRVLIWDVIGILWLIFKEVTWVVMWMRSKRLECSSICILPPDTQVFYVRVTVNSSSLIRHLVLSILPSKSFFNSPPLLQSHCTEVTSLSPLTETMEIDSTTSSLTPLAYFSHGPKTLLQNFTLTGRTDAEAEASILWSPDAKNWLTGKDTDAGKDWRQEEKGTDRGWDGWMASPTGWTWV